MPDRAAALAIAHRLLALGLSVIPVPRPRLCSSQRARRRRCRRSWREFQSGCQPAPSSIAGSVRVPQNRGKSPAICVVVVDADDTSRCAGAHETFHIAVGKRKHAAGFTCSTPSELAFPIMRVSARGDGGRRPARRWRRGGRAWFHPRAGIRPQEAGDWTQPRARPLFAGLARAAPRPARRRARPWPTGSIMQARA